MILYIYIYIYSYPKRFASGDRSLHPSPKAQSHPKGRPQHREDRGFRLEPRLPRRRGGRGLAQRAAHIRGELVDDLTSIHAKMGWHLGRT